MEKYQGLLEAAKLAVYGFFAWLQIDIQVFGVLMLLMCVDSFIGAIKAVRLGYDFSFKQLLWGFCLKFCFLIIPLIVALIGKNLGQDYSLGVDIVMKILTVSEGYSIFGNIYSAKNKVEVKRLDIISMLLKSLRKGLRSILDKLLGALEQGGGCKIEKDEDKNVEE